MATIPLVIPDAQLSRVVDAFASEYGWTQESGLTKAQFAKKQIVEYTKGVVRAYEIRLAERTARETAEATAPPDIT